MSETDKPFTVNDRRHFTADGRPREKTEPEAPEVSPGSAGDDVSPTPGRSATPPSEERPSVEAPAPSPGTKARQSAIAPADFSGFLLSLGAQASILLSGRGAPEDVDPDEALEGARSIISILEMLRDKTAGRRTRQEDEVLEGLLFELRMAYVNKSRAGGS